MNCDELWTFYYKQGQIIGGRLALEHKKAGEFYPQLHSFQDRDFMGPVTYLNVISKAIGCGFTDGYYDVVTGGPGPKEVGG